jgi:hypothetical protein
LHRPAPVATVAPAPEPGSESEPGGEPRSAPACPFCSSREADVLSLFGTQAMTLQYRCLGCGTIYEAIKYEPDPAEEQGREGSGRR